MDFEKKVSWTCSGFKDEKEAREWRAEVSYLYPGAETGVEKDEAGRWKAWLVFEKSNEQLKEDQ